MIKPPQKLLRHGANAISGLGSVGEIHRGFARMGGARSTTELRCLLVFDFDGGNLKLVKQHATDKFTWDWMKEGRQRG